MDKSTDYPDRRIEERTQRRLEAIDRSWAAAAVEGVVAGWPTLDPRPGSTVVVPAQPVKRVFDTGASRDADVHKLDFDGTLSPQVLERYAQYLLDHQVMADGSRRPMDNWQKGIPMASYVKSAWRHFIEWWKWTRSPQIANKVIEEAACGILFNVMGWLHEHLKAKASRAGAVAQASKP